MASTELYQETSRADLNNEATPEPNEIMGACNIWRGLYEEARQGYLQLDGLKISMVEGSMCLAAPKQANILVTKPNTNDSASMDLSYLLDYRPTENGYVGTLFSVELNQGGQPGKCQIAELNLDKRHRPDLAPLSKEVRQLQSRDLTKLGQIFDDLQARRKAAMERRMQLSDNKQSLLGKMVSKLQNQAQD